MKIKKHGFSGSKRPKRPAGPRIINQGQPYPFELYGADKKSIV